MGNELDTKEMKVQVLKSRQVEEQPVQQKQSYGQDRKTPEQMEQESRQKMRIYLKKYAVSKKVAEGLQKKMSGIMQEMDEIRKSHAGESAEALDHMTRGLQNRYARLEKEMNLQKQHSKEWELKSAEFSP